MIYLWFLNTCIFYCVSGMSEYNETLCPIAHYCAEASEPVLCPAGRMRPNPGAGAPTECPLCRPGYYCPNDTENTMGIPCNATYECPEGASIPVYCRPGHYCPQMTGTPPICPGGYYCPAATDIPILCEYPDYCPEGSNATRMCNLGYQSMNHAGLRQNMSVSCRICPAGTYSNSTNRSSCDTCPSGYYCPPGTGNGDTHECPVGSYCPIGSGEPLPCLAGSYGKRARAASPSDCALCPAQYYTDIPGMKACKPCGSSAESKVGSVLCTCRGKYRSFQPSDGSCTCESGYIYYDETDLRKEEGNSEDDCQPRVDTRCSADEARDSSTRQCVKVNRVDCSEECGADGGNFNADFGK